MYFFPTRSLILLLLFEIFILIGQKRSQVQCSILTETLFDGNVISQLLRGKNALTISSTFIKNYLSSRDLEGNPCYEDLKRVATGILNLEEWALSMIDAIGKPEANILSGNIGWPGNFKECLKVKNGTISGKYCWIETLVKPSKNGVIKFPIWAICVPDSCHNKDLEPLLLPMKGLIKKEEDMPNSDITAGIECLQNPMENATSDVAFLIAMGICCMVIVFAVIGTFLDMRMRAPYKNVKNRDDNIILIQNEKNSNRDYYSLSTFLMYFSIYSNCQKLFSLKQEKSSSPELNGLKVISTALVIFFHSFFYIIPVTDNPAEVSAEFGNVYLQIIPLVIYMIDAFFFMASFLIFTHILKTKCRGNNTGNCQFIVAYIFSRYLKLLLCPGIIMFVFRIGLLPYLAYGPFWGINELTCKSTWWQNVLFISNWYPEAEQCFVAWWFLSVSMQLHVISLVIIVPLINKRYLIAIFNGFILLVLCWSWVGWKAYQLDLPGYYTQPNLSGLKTFGKKRCEFHDNIYMNPAFHYAAYSIGMLFSWFMLKRKDAISLTKKQVNLGWSVWSLTFIFVAYCIYFKPGRLIKSLYLVFVGTISTLIVIWLVVLCNTKNKGFVSSFLRWKYWLPLSKLSLTAYLMQISVIEYFYLSVDTKYHYTFLLSFLFFLRNWVLTYACAILITLTVDMPVNSILNVILKRLF